MVLSRLVMDPKDSNFKGQKVQFILLPQKCKIENAVSMRFLSPKKSSNFIFQFRIASGFIFYCGLWYFLRRHHQIYIPWIRGRREIIAFPVWPTSSKHKHSDAFHHLIYLLILITNHYDCLENSTTKILGQTKSKARSPLLRIRVGPLSN